jgi:alkanesulfonate monooxygenase SsuD/methylene tetrahydromethanopterin reductase-like flavin-dependent oxidoreductase (luciferase family)
VRFAFKTSPQDTTWAAMLEVWRAADDIEVFESGWTSDHFYPMRTADLSGSRLEGWMTLTALAQATRRLRLGTLVTGIHYRHPAVLANMAATLDIASGGRLEIGIGAGWNEQRSAIRPGAVQRRPGGDRGRRHGARCRGRRTRDHLPAAAVRTVGPGAPGAGPLSLMSALRVPV